MGKISLLEPVGQELAVKVMRNMEGSVLMTVLENRVYSFSGYQSNLTVRSRKFPRVAVILTFVFAMFQGCASVYTFPNIARQGDTVAVMVGGSETVRKDTIDATLTDSDEVTWDLQALGLIRSVFNLRPEGRAHGLHYADFISKNTAWNKGHEPIQTVLIFDVPVGAQLGAATLSVDLNASDDSSGVIQPFSIAMQIVDVPGQPGASDSFLRQNFDTSTPPVNFEDLEGLCNSGRRVGSC